MHAPNLRGAAVAEILTALIDGCQQMGGTGVDARSSPTKVEILDGQVYPQHSVPDRKARVHAVAYLNDGSWPSPPFGCGCRIGPRPQRGRLR